MKLLNRCVALKQTGYGGNHVVCGDIKYRPRVFFDGDLPGHAGLYKPEDERRLPEEEEFRLLWEPRRGHPPLTGFLVEDPELARYCERVA